METTQRTITVQECLKHIQSLNGKIFSIIFVKRTDGNFREMVCRCDVKSHLVDNPSKPPIDFRKHNLLSVWDMQKQGYRCIPHEGIAGIKIDGEWVGVE